jgi:hypothetical protein
MKPNGLLDWNCPLACLQIFFIDACDDGNQSSSLDFNSHSLAHTLSVDQEYLKILSLSAEILCIVFVLCSQRQRCALCGGTAWESRRSMRLEGRAGAAHTGH